MEAIITVRGNLGKDVKLSFSGDLPIASFSIAYTPRVKRNGDWSDGETMWFKVTAFGTKAEAVADTLKVGDAVLVTGKLKQSTYTNKEGKEITGLEITADEVAVAIKNGVRAQTSTEDKAPW
jgi:single-strand DNA-binding protein